MIFRYALLLLVFCGITLAAPAHAATEAEQAELIAKLVARIDALEAEMAEMKRDRADAAPPPRAAPERAPVTPAAPLPANTTPVAAAPEAPAETREQEEINTAVNSALVKHNVVLLSPGQYELEPSFTYAPTSSDFVSIDGFSIFPVLVVGSVTTEQVRKDNMIASLTGRAGLPWGFQADVKIPYQYSLEERTRADGTFRMNEDYGLGDITLGLSKELWIGSGSMPNLIGRVSWKTTTGDSIYDGADVGIGSGFDAVRADLTALRFIDPAAVYATLGYTVNFADDKGASGDIDPGDSISAAVGTTLALNRDIALSFGFDGQWTQASTLNNVTVNGSSFNVGNMTLGMTYQLWPGRRLDMGFAAGLTRDAPDYSVTLSMPFRF
jgi:hypothetical protein